MQFSTSRVSRLATTIKFLVITFALLFTARGIAAQSTQVRLSVESSSGTARIEIKSAPRRVWTFANSYGSLLDLSRRIEAIGGSDEASRMIPLVRAAPGEWRADRDVSLFKYSVKLAIPLRPADHSHVSFITGEYGLLMLRDLLPQQIQTDIDLVIEVPLGWSSASLNSVGPSRYKLTDAEKAVIAIGKSLRETTVRSGPNQIRVVTSGKWNSRASDVGKVTRELLNEYTRVFRRRLLETPTLFLFPFLEGAGPDRWTAETRGSTVTLLMGDEAKRRPALGWLRVVLAHEMLHLWVPNAVALKGDYDWFFEGFTIYQALLTGLRLRYIRFEDYLETLGRVYDSYHSSTERDRLSLVEASERRWTSISSLVYDKGALVAFLYDLMLRQNTSLQETVTDIYSEVLDLRAGNDHDANQRLMLLLNNRRGMKSFSERFVQGTTDIDLAAVLPQFGLEILTKGSGSRIQVSSSISTDQRQLLRSFGYKE